MLQTFQREHDTSATILLLVFGKYRKITKDNKLSKIKIKSKQNLTVIVLEAKIPIKYKYDTKLEIKGKSKAHLFNQFNSIVP